MSVFMIKKVFYNSSMPRSCSTLLQNILAQNPDIYATPTDGVLELIYGAMSNFSTSPEFKAQDQELMKKGFYGFVKNSIEGFYEGITESPYVITKSRGWILIQDLLENSFQSPPKIIYMCRNLKDILSSMEKMHRENFINHPRTINHTQMQGTTVEKRIDMWVGSQPIGLALDRLKDLVQQKKTKNILFVKAENITKEPSQTMKKIYNYLEIPFFNHNFDHVEQITKEDDSVYGISPNLHKIKTKITPLQSDAEEILGKHVCGWIDQQYDWYNRLFGYGKYIYNGELTDG
jgi:sulfotransferase